MEAISRRRCFALGATLLAGAALSTVTTEHAEAAYPRYGLTAEQWQVIQKVMRHTEGRYTGAIDGDPGPETWKAVQRWLRRFSWDPGPIDGIPGYRTWRSLQHHMRFWYPYTPDGVFGPRTARALRNWAESLR
ncbi:MAG: peptidoglycan-binding protein [Propionibacteriaceae bacterium]|nr:peptidoglycan-binding protein [Propionibacteriaceae bacterium]